MTSSVHLCVTHSALVTRVFGAAMRHLGVPESDVVYVTRRGVACPVRGICLDDLSDEMERSFNSFDRRGYRNARSQLFGKLRELTAGRPFEIYVPHLNKLLYQELVGSPDCTGYSFLEEGFTSMAWSGRHNARLNFSKTLRMRLRTWWTGPRYRFAREMFDHSSPKYRAAYAISAHAFHGMPGKVDVSHQLPSFPEGIAPGSTYLILDAAYLHQKIRWEDYERALVKCIRAHAIPHAPLLVKFHFADSKAPERFASLREHLGGSLQLLGAEFSVEENLTKEDRLLFAFTSLGYYAALAGIDVRCFAEEINGVSLDDWMATARLPADFREVVGLRGK